MALYYAPGAGFMKELLRGAIQYFRAVYNISIDLFRNGLWLKALFWHITLAGVVER